MNSKKGKARVLVHIPAIPSVFGSVETWTQGKQFNCSWNRNSAERNVRAGRDSDEAVITLYYNPATVKIRTQDRILIDDRTYAILYLREDTSGEDTNYMELKAL